MTRRRITETAAIERLQELGYRFVDSRVEKYTTMFSRNRKTGEMKFTSAIGLSVVAPENSVLGKHVDKNRKAREKATRARKSRTDAVRRKFRPKGDA